MSVSHTEPSAIAPLTLLTIPEEIIALISEHVLEDKLSCDYTIYVQGYPVQEIEDVPLVLVCKKLRKVVLEVIYRKRAVKIHLTDLTEDWQWERDKRQRFLKVYGHKVRNIILEISTSPYFVAEIPEQVDTNNQKVILDNSTKFKTQFLKYDVFGAVESLDGNKKELELILRLLMRGRTEEILTLSVTVSRNTWWDHYWIVPDGKEMTFDEYIHIIKELFQPLKLLEGRVGVVNDSYPNDNEEEGCQAFIGQVVRDLVMK